MTRITNIFAEEALFRYQNHCVRLHGCETLEELLDREWEGDLPDHLKVASHIRTKLFGYGQISSDESLAYQRLESEIFNEWRERRRLQKLNG